MKCYLPEITPARLGSAVFLLWLFSLMGPSPIPAAQAPGSSAGANQGNAQPVEAIVLASQAQNVKLEKGDALLLLVD